MPVQTQITPEKSGVLAPLTRPAKKLLARFIRVLNRLYRRSAGGEDRPAFYDIDETLPCLRLLDKNYAAIREEMEGVLQYKDRIPRYHDLDQAETYISGTIDPEKDWKVFMLRSLAGTPEENQAKCPRTTALLCQLPNVYQAFFSILDPGKSIPAHCGTYLGYLRYHLGLRVPKDEPPRMRVKDQIHVWREGRSILFDDSLEHEVYNKSEDLRVVLIVDLLRPMPFHLHACNWTLTRMVRHSEEAKQSMARLKKFS